MIIINVPLQNPIDRYHGIKQYMHGTVTLITARPQPHSPHPVYKLDMVENVSVCLESTSKVPPGQSHKEYIGIDCRLCAGSPCVERNVYDRKADTWHAKRDRWTSTRGTSC